MDINKLITPAPKPDYDKEVLVPLRQKQLEAARIKALLAEQAKELERKKSEALESSRSVVQVALTAPADRGQCYAWMEQAGIADKDTAYLLITKESGCNPCKYNPGKTNCSLTAYEVNATDGNADWGGVACGIGQQLPCGKWPHAWNDPVGGLMDMQGYVFGRYGSWANAWAHSQAFGWY